MSASSWYPAENGATLGQSGSEQGVIVHDEEHAFGARITLERDTTVAPFAITCGIYGWMLHTRWFGEQAEAERQYAQMKAVLGALLEGAEETAETDGGSRVLYDGIEQFVKIFP